jgi:hypothetical protein
MLMRVVTVVRRISLESSTELVSDCCLCTAEISHRTVDCESNSDKETIMSLNICILFGPNVSARFSTTDSNKLAAYWFQAKDLVSLVMSFAL